MKEIFWIAVIIQAIIQGVCILFMSWVILSVKHEMVAVREQTKQPVLYQVETGYVIIGPEANWDVKTKHKEK